MKKKVNTTQKLPVIVILGPTSSGKTKLAVDLAMDFQGEIISADSRQVYRGMDIGTGKDLIEYQRGSYKVRYHLIDVASPKQNFNLRRYQVLAFKAINNILRRHKLPIVTGGSGLYLQALIDNYVLPREKKDKSARVSLELLGADKLFSLILQKQSDFASRLNNSDRNNPRRLARYLEIINNNGFVGAQKRLSPYNFIIFGLEISDEDLRAKIRERLLFRLQQGLINEVKSLRESGLSYQRLINFGLEYKFVTFFLQGKITEDDMIDKLVNAIYRFAKKQKTWFKRFEKQGGKINWIKNKEEVHAKLSNLLKKSAL